jgi:hypothetical protein
MAREFDGSLGRREFLMASAAWAMWPTWARADAEALSPATLSALQTSPYVYVSPLRSDGSESRCHGEVWFGWIDDAVVLNTAPTTWKGRALEKGLLRTRIWVGDYGRAGGVLGSEKFRAGPSFDALASRVTDRAVNEGLLAIYDEKYPGSIDRWRDKMRQGFESGERIAIRYAPVTNKL